MMRRRPSLAGFTRSSLFSAQNEMMEGKKRKRAVSASRHAASQREPLTGQLVHQLALRHTQFPALHWILQDKDVSDKRPSMGNLRQRDHTWPSLLRQKTKE